jgi:hypothetical protein
MGGGDEFAIGTLQFAIMNHQCKSITLILFEIK